MGGVGDALMGGGGSGVGGRVGGAQKFPGRGIHLLTTKPSDTNQPANQLAQSFSSLTITSQTSPRQLSNKLAQRQLSLPSNPLLTQLRRALLLPERAKAALREPLPSQLPSQLLLLLASPLLLLNTSSVEPA